MNLCFVASENFTFDKSIPLDSKNRFTVNKEHSSKEYTLARTDELEG